MPDQAPEGAKNVAGSPQPQQAAGQHATAAAPLRKLTQQDEYHGLSLPPLDALLRVSLIPIRAEQDAAVLRYLIESKSLDTGLALALLKDLSVEERAVLQAVYKPVDPANADMKVSALHVELARCVPFTREELNTVRILLAKDPVTETLSVAKEQLELGNRSTVQLKTQAADAELKITDIQNYTNGTRQLIVTSKHFGTLQYQPDEAWQRGLAGFHSLCENLKPGELKQLVGELGKECPRMVYNGKGEKEAATSQDSYLDGLELIKRTFNQGTADYVYNRVAGFESHAQVQRLYTLRSNGQLAPEKIGEFLETSDDKLLVEVFSLFKKDFPSGTALTKYFGVDETTGHGRLLQMLGQSSGEREEIGRLLHAAKIIDNAITVDPTRPARIEIPELEHCLMKLTPTERRLTMATVLKLLGGNGTAIPGIAASSPYGKLINMLSTKPSAGSPEELSDQQFACALSSCALLSAAGVDLTRDPCTAGHRGVVFSQLASPLAKLGSNEQQAIISQAKSFLGTPQKAIFGLPEDSPVAKVFSQFVANEVPAAALLAQLQSLELMDALDINILESPGQTNPYKSSRPDVQGVRQAFATKSPAERKSLTDISRSLLANTAAATKINLFDQAIERFAHEAYNTDSTILRHRSYIGEREKLYREQLSGLLSLAKITFTQGIEADNRLEELRKSNTGAVDFTINKVNTAVTGKAGNSVRTEVKLQSKAAFDTMENAHSSYDVWNRDNVVFAGHANEFKQSYIKATISFATTGADGGRHLDKTNLAFEKMKALPVEPGKTHEELRWGYSRALNQSSANLANIEAPFAYIEQLAERAGPVLTVAGAMVAGAAATGAAIAAGWTTPAIIGAGFVGGTAGGTLVGGANSFAEAGGHVLTGNKSVGKAVTDAGWQTLHHAGEAAKTSLAIAPAIGVTSRIISAAGKLPVSGTRWMAAHTIGGGSGGAVFNGIGKAEALHSYHKARAELEKSGTVTDTVDLKLRKDLRIDSWSLVKDALLDTSFGVAFAGTGGAFTRAGITNPMVNTTAYSSLSAVHRYSREGAQLQYTMEDILLGGAGAAMAKSGSRIPGKIPSEGTVAKPEVRPEPSSTPAKNGAGSGENAAPSQGRGDGVPAAKPTSNEEPLSLAENAAGEWVEMVGTDGKVTLVKRALAAEPSLLEQAIATTEKKTPLDRVLEETERMQRRKAAARDAAAEKLLEDAIAAIKPRQPDARAASPSRPETSEILPQAKPALAAARPSLSKLRFAVDDTAEDDFVMQLPDEEVQKKAKQAGLTLTRTDGAWTLFGKPLEHVWKVSPKSKEFELGDSYIPHMAGRLQHWGSDLYFHTAMNATAETSRSPSYVLNPYTPAGRIKDARTLVAGERTLKLKHEFLHVVSDALLKDGTVTLLPSKMDNLFEYKKQLPNLSQRKSTYQYYFQSTPVEEIRTFANEISNSIRFLEKDSIKPEERKKMGDEVVKKLEFLEDLITAVKFRFEQDAETPLHIFNKKMWDGLSESKKTEIAGQNVPWVEDLFLLNSQLVLGIPDSKLSVYPLGLGDEADNGPLSPERVTKLQQTFQKDAETAATRLDRGLGELQAMVPDLGLLPRPKSDVFLYAERQFTGLKIHCNPNASPEAMREGWRSMRKVIMAMQSLRPVSKKSEP